jgi:hypothetical protein
MDLQQRSSHQSIETRASDISVNSEVNGKFIDGDGGSRGPRMQQDSTQLRITDRLKRVHSLNLPHESIEIAEPGFAAG